MTFEKINLIKTTKKGTRLKVPCSIVRENGRIYWYGAGGPGTKAPFEIKDEIKAMKGSKWHGYIDGDNRKLWSVEDCTRNNFQLHFITGGNPYANWDQPLRKWGYARSLYEHQKLMADTCLTYHYTILAAEMGVGKSLSAIEVMEQSGTNDWWYIAPKSGIAAIEREWSKWGLGLQPKVMTYARLRINIERWEDGMPAPQGVIFDESSRLKSGVAKRTKAAMWLADSIRKEHGWDGFVILMTGTPAPKSPLDWWSQCEVCYPGFLKEGSPKAFEWRMAIFEKQMTEQGEFWKRKTWRDDELKCNTCGEYAEHENHEVDDVFGMGEDSHEWEKSKNEVSYLHERLDGLVLTLKKKDCLDIPEKIYREVILEPTTTLKRVAKALAASASTAIQGITWLRELSDGFQYHNKQEGVEPCKVCSGEGVCEQWTTPEDDTLEEPEKVSGTCEKCGGEGTVPRMVRETKELKCPKEGAVRDLLEENEDQGRLVLFSGFHGSIDKIVKLCHTQCWDVVKVDGRGWKILRHDGESVDKAIKPLDYWADMNTNDKVAFVAHPESGGMGLTLTEARMAVFYSNDFKPENRMQAEDRIHRPGMDENKGATIVDLFHLGTDRKVLAVLRDNRRLENMTLGELQDALDA